ncbi:MAG: DNA repair protein rad52 [Bathelium mastoideum]|nr:MAG: DNA repair protein rad52 [Bathelium mastoideum]KAI9688569.1 MAG: DNA repair protein rad52 [Bathelium mastoideum]
MPAQNELQRDVSAVPNPFENPTPHISMYTAQEIATLQCRLDKQLGPEYISSRPGAGGAKVYYLAAEKAINLANEVFGFNGWSSAIKNVQIDFVDEDRNTGKISLGLSIIVRVTLRDGTFHEDIGYGHIENCKGKAAAFEKAKKEAATDALKRALRNFGNVLGNCLYDRQYLQRVTKIKMEPSRWDVDNLHRHHDYAPIKKGLATEESGENKIIKPPRTSSTISDVSHGDGDYDEFGADVFDETDMIHTDEVIMDSLMSGNETSHSTSNQQGAIALVRNQSTPKTPQTHSMSALRPPSEVGASHIPGLLKPSPLSANIKQDDERGEIIPPRTSIGLLSKGDSMPPPPVSKQQDYRRTPTHNLGAHQTDAGALEDKPLLQQPSKGLSDGSEHREISIGFIPSRAAETLLKSDGPPAQMTAVPAYNPHAESPSIRRTSGINHAKSEPITRKGIVGLNNQIQGAQPMPSSNPTQFAGGATSVVPRPIRGPGQGPANFVNPQSDLSRRIGVPTSGIANPFAHRAGYKSPVTKRFVAGVHETSGVGDGAGRVPLSDVSNTAADNHAPFSGGDRGKGDGKTANLDDEGGGDKKRTKVADG